jgi:nucleotide-binding universal stress UspA family protein
MPYKRIMVAVDGSPTSDLAFIEALHLSQSLQAMLCIIHIVGAFPCYNLGIGVDFDRCQEIIRDDGLAILEKMKKNAQKQYKLVETKLINITDANKSISEKLIEAAESYQADLLVLGTHGRRGMNRFLLGSVAEETVRRAEIPVLLVRAKQDI